MSGTMIGVRCFICVGLLLTGSPEVLRSDEYDRYEAHGSGTQPSEADRIYSCAVKDFEIVSPIPAALIKIENPRVVYTPTASSYHQFDLRNLGTTPISAIAVVLHYMDDSKRSIDDVPIIAVAEGASNITLPPFPSEAVLRWDAAVSSGDVAPMAAVKNGVRTGICPTRAEITYASIRFSDGTTRTYSRSGWKLGPAPRKVPWFPIALESFVAIPFTLLIQLEIDERGEVVGVADHDGWAQIPTWLPAYFKQNWKFYPSLNNGQATSSKMVILFRVHRGGNPECYEPEPFLQPLTLIQLLPRSEVSPYHNSAAAFLVTYGELQEGTVMLAPPRASKSLIVVTDQHSHWPKR